MNVTVYSCIDLSSVTISMPKITEFLKKILTPIFIKKKSKYLVKYRIVHILLHSVIRNTTNSFQARVGMPFENVLSIVILKSVAGMFLLL